MGGLLVVRRSGFAVHVAASYGNEEACANVLADWLDGVEWPAFANVA
jgi:hypothetical protein